MRASLSLIFGLTLLAHCASAPAQILRKGKAYQFRANYVRGARMSFNFRTVVTPINSTVKNKQVITFPVSMLVQEVRMSKENGRVAKIRSEAGPWLLNNKPYQPKTNVTVHVDSLNRLVGQVDQEIPQFATPLPEKALKIGESWTSNIDTGEAAPMAMKVKATYKLLRVAGAFATIGVSLTGRGAGNSNVLTRGQGTMRLRTRDGTLQSMALNQIVTVSNGMGAQTVITVTRKA